MADSEKMGDATEEKTLASTNSSTKEKLLKSEKLSDEKFEAPSDCCEERVEKLYEGIKPDKITESKSKEKGETKEEKPIPVEEAKEIEKEKQPEQKEVKQPEKEEEKQLEKKAGSEIKISEENLDEKPVNKISDSVPCCPNEPKEKIVRNQSDIFSLKDVATTLQTSIFSVNGSPSRRVFRKQEPAGHVFQRNEEPPSDKTSTPTVNRITRENYNDEKRPSSSYRNPLTGTGLSSNDEYKSKGIKRKDGNPLLGLGYDSEVTSTSSQHRVPPGGYSHKLW